MQFNYLNIKQSPIPWATGGYKTFVVTKDAGPPAVRIDQPVDGQADGRHPDDAPASRSRRPASR